MSEPLRPSADAQGPLSRSARSARSARSSRASRASRATGADSASAEPFVVSGASPPLPDPIPSPSAGLATRAVHGGQHPDPGSGALLTPIFQSTTFAQVGLPGDPAHAGDAAAHTYSRGSNPTVAALERGLAALEDAPGALAFSSGMAALSTLAVGLLRAGDRVVCSEVVYGGTVRLLRDLLAPLGVHVEFIDTTDLAELETALREETRLVLIESPANPTLVLTDIAAAASAARDAGALLAVDNTFLTPAGQRPLDLGADLTVSSTTKFVEGHNATLGGAIVARDPALLERLKAVRTTLGTIQAPFDAWLTLRGLKTLPLRLERHAANALQVAEFLEASGTKSGVLGSVHYPGLASFPQRELALRQQAHGGGVLAFELTGGVEAARVFCRSLRVATLAENLGAVESLVTHPATMTHWALAPEERSAIGVTDGLVRLSVGLEEPADLIADLAQALAAVAASEAEPARELEEVQP